MKRSLFVSAFIVGALPSFATTIIKQASEYTVSISAAVEYAFGEEKKNTTQGAGFLIDRERGWILTNAHVARRAPATIRVNFRGQTPFLARRIYIDAHLDLAILEIPPASIPVSAIPAKLDCSAMPEPGQAVIAFGHPWGLDFTATRGIISGIKSLDGVEMLQTDAAVNPGNSGGALIHEGTGHILGINTSGLNKSKSEGMNFATPGRFACTIINLLFDKKDPSPPVLPIRFAETFRDGELVVAIVADPWRGKLEIGDRISAVDGDRTATYSSRFIDKIRGKTAAQVTVRRGEREVSFDLTLPAERETLRQSGVNFSGMLVSSVVDPITKNQSLKIENVDASSLAQQAQMRLGDDLIALDGREMKSIQDLFVALKADSRRGRELIFRRAIQNEKDRYSYIVRRIDVENEKYVTEDGPKERP